MKTKLYYVGDHMDTDLIIAARYLNKTEKEHLGAHVFEDYDQNFKGNEEKYKGIVAGQNFGCGSSREHAPIAIMASGIQVVFAKSYARIFYRNAINLGLRVVIYDEWIFGEEEELEVDFVNNEVKNQKGKTMKIEAYPEFLQEIVSVGGLIEYGKRQITVGS